MKTIRVPMRYVPTGERLYWTVQRVRTFSGPAWTFTSEDGCERYGGKTWLELLERFNLTAENYAMAHTLS